VVAQRPTLHHICAAPRSFVLFQNVSSLDIFIGANHGGGEETAISKLLLVGEQIVQAGLKRSADQQAASTKGDWLNS